MVSAHPHNPLSRALPAVAILIVLGALIAALVLIGSPMQQRHRRADEERVQDLNRVKYAVDGFYREQKRLPKSLAELSQRNPTLDVQDALTQRPYDYRVLGSEAYELGAVFDTDTSNLTRAEAARTEHGWYLWGDESLPFWKHGNGPQRFTLKTEKDKTP